MTITNTCCLKEIVDPVRLQQVIDAANLPVAGGDPVRCVSRGILSYN